MDKREAILVRLVEIAGGLAGIKTAVRNQDEISERARPAIAIFDADETADERANEQGHAGRAPNIIEMSPEALILLGGTPERVGTALNEMRAKFVKAVLTDAQLAITHRDERSRALRRLQHASRPWPFDGRQHGRAFRVRLRAAARPALT